MTLQYEPIGRVKLSRAQKWKKKAKDLLVLIRVVGVSAFLFGAICGVFVGTMIL